MAKPIISVENLGKRYAIGHEVQRSAGNYRRLSEELVDAAKSVFRRRDVNQSVEQFWALRDVSFEVKQGDVLGIIGRNGAGKSTLLKILSRITEPSEGRVRIRGRVASLLEVGTGFHQELTGRENIYLNGAILGMSRAEIGRKFDEIVEFAEVAKFLDTPVKRYSSGMYVRLAFAVAAHLDPEILVVDEVLAVGDTEFQRKCLGRMSAIGQSGRTVLFVSHNMAAVKALCRTALALESGQVFTAGDADEVVDVYHRKSAGSASHDYRASGSSSTGPSVRQIQIRQDETIASSLAEDQPFEILVKVASADYRNVACAIVIRNMQGVWVHHSSDEFAPDSDQYTTRTTRRCTLPPYALNAGSYLLSVSLFSRSLGVVFERLEDVVSFEIAFRGRMAERTPVSAWKGACGPGLPQWT